jgi:hypothetical protein
LLQASRDPESLHVVDGTLWTYGRVDVDVVVVGVVMLVMVQVGDGGYEESLARRRTKRRGWPRCDDEKRCEGEEKDGEERQPPVPSSSS